MMYIPILLRMLEAANIPIRFLPRDSHLELMDRYLTNGKRFIPIFIFIDEAGNEVTKWGPMAPDIEKFVNELKATLPEKDSPEYEEAWRSVIQQTGQTFTEDANIWQTVYDDIFEKIVQAE